MIDVEIFIELLKESVIKLLAIINDDDSKQTKLVDNKLPNEVVGVPLNDLDKWFYLDPPGKVVNRHDKKFFCLVAKRNGPRLFILH